MWGRWRDVRSPSRQEAGKTTGSETNWGKNLIKQGRTCTESSDESAEGNLKAVKHEHQKSGENKMTYLKIGNEKKTNK